MKIFDKYLAIVRLIKYSVWWRYTGGVIRWPKVARLEQLKANHSRCAAPGPLHTPPRSTPQAHHLNGGLHMRFALSPIQMGDGMIHVHTNWKVPPKGRYLFEVDFLCFGPALGCTLWGRASNRQSAGGLRTHAVWVASQQASQGCPQAVPTGRLITP